jgi:hypothetical protein
MTAETQHRAYGKLRDIVERHGGSMTWQREDYRYGAWLVALNGKTTTFEATGMRSFPKLDRLYVPRIVSPTQWNHYRNELLDDAEEVFLASLT